MNEAVSAYVMVAWMVAMLVAFPLFTPHRAILFAFFSGMLFLPEVHTGILSFGPVKFTKFQTIAYTALLGTVLYDSTRLFQIVPARVDMPLLCFLAWAFVSPMMNAPPPDGSSQIRDALSQCLAAIVGWGIPYWLGRVYFSRGETLRDVVMAFVVAACVYTPLCLWEIRFSPQLNAKVYGFMQHEFGQSIRFGGYRPIVFMQHGLAVGLVMVFAAFLSVWLNRTDRLPVRYLLVLAPMAILVKSTGAIALGAFGLGAIFLSKVTGLRVFLLVLIGLSPCYVFTRTTGLWSGRSLTQFTSETIDADRAASLEFRLANEDLLIQKALERPLTGWGGWGRGRIYDENGKDISVTDGLWIIVMGDRGLVGIVLILAVILGPALCFAYRFSPDTWHLPELAPATGLVFLLALWSVDNIFNAMVMPIFVLIAGAFVEWRPESPEGATSYNVPYVYH